MTFFGDAANSGFICRQGQLSGSPNGGMLKISVRFYEHESFAMRLRLDQVSLKEGLETHLYPLGLQLEPG